MSYCPECGVEVEEGQTYCRECGAPLYEPEGRSEEDTDHPTSDESVEEDVSDDRVKTGQEFEDEDLFSFALKYPYRNGFTPLLIGGALGVIYLLFFIFLYFVALFLLIPFSFVGVAVLGSGEGDPALSATFIAVIFIGSLLFYLVSLIPVYPVAGYMVKLTKNAAVGEYKPPGFDDWNELFMLGVKSMVLIVLPLSILTSLVQYGPVIALELYASEYLQTIGGVAAYIVSILLWMYLAPPLLVNYSLHEEVRKAYSLDGFRSFVFNSSYTVHYLMSVVLLAALLILDVVIGIASALTIIGWIFVVPALVFYTYASMGSFWGRVYYKTLGDT